jgi:16S rRNA (adenine1518-N6/adenine1519-N6)-dimethyltransferase
MTDPLLGPRQVRELADRLGIRPTKSLGQNFVVDAGTVRRIVRAAALEPGQGVVEVGPGLGSLTLALLDAGHPVTAVEIDPVLARQLPVTVAERLGSAERLTVLNSDALEVGELPAPLGGPTPTALVANLPYNVAVPVLLRFWRLFNLDRALVMVQAEVAERLVATPGSRIYGVPSVKAAWYSHARPAGGVGQAAFWPVPRVDSALVAMRRREPPPTQGTRAQVFAVVDAAFAQRRKMLRSALAGIAGSAQRAGSALEAAGLDPTSRGERLDVVQFAAVTDALIAAGVEITATRDGA